MRPIDVRAALWADLVVRAEAFHDAVVLGQRRADLRTAARLEKRASEVLVLSKAIQMTIRARAEP